MEKFSRKTLYNPFFIEETYFLEVIYIYIYIVLFLALWPLFKLKSLTEAFIFNLLNLKNLIYLQLTSDNPTYIGLSVCYLGSIIVLPTCLLLNGLTRLTTDV
jgi:hypothetical protein